MKKKLLPVLMAIVFAQGISTLTAQNVSLCDGVNYIHKNLTKNGLPQVPYNYAARIAGWNEVLKTSEEEETYLYVLSFKVGGNDPSILFTKMQDELIKCLGVAPKTDGIGNAMESTFLYHGSALLLYQRHTPEETWIMLNIGLQE